MLRLRCCRQNDDDGGILNALVNMKPYLYPVFLHRALEIPGHKGSSSYPWECRIGLGNSSHLMIATSFELQKSLSNPGNAGTNSLGWCSASGTYKSCSEHADLQVCTSRRLLFAHQGSIYPNAEVLLIDTWYFAIKIWWRNATISILAGNLSLPFHVINYSEWVVVFMGV